MFAQVFLWLYVLTQQVATLFNSAVRLVLTRQKKHLCLFPHPKWLNLYVTTCLIHQVTIFLKKIKFYVGTSRSYRSCSEMPLALVNTIKKLIIVNQDCSCHIEWLMLKNKLTNMVSWKIIDLTTLSTFRVLTVPLLFSQFLLKKFHTIVVKRWRLYNCITDDIKVFVDNAENSFILLSYFFSPFNMQMKLTAISKRSVIDFISSELNLWWSTQHNVFRTVNISPALKRTDLINVESRE